MTKATAFLDRNPNLRNIYVSYLNRDKGMSSVCDQNNQQLSYAFGSGYERQGAALAHMVNTHMQDLLKDLYDRYEHDMTTNSEGIRSCNSLVGFGYNEHTKEFFIDPIYGETIVTGILAKAGILLEFVINVRESINSGYNVYSLRAI